VQTHRKVCDCSFRSSICLCWLRLTSQGTRTHPTVSFRPSEHVLFPWLLQKYTCSHHDPDFFPYVGKNGYGNQLGLKSMHVAAQLAIFQVFLLKFHFIHCITSFQDTECDGHMDWQMLWILYIQIQWNLYSLFSSGVWKRNNGSRKTIDAGAIVEIGFAQGP
jgi:hypothetical protein